MSVDKNIILFSSLYGSNIHWISGIGDRYLYLQSTGDGGQEEGPAYLIGILIGLDVLGVHSYLAQRGRYSIFSGPVGAERERGHMQT